MIKFHLKRNLRAEQRQKANEKGKKIAVAEKAAANNKDFKIIPIEAKKQKKPLFLVMQKKYFDLILSGEKTEEARDKTEYYKRRFFNVSKKTGEILTFKNFDLILMQEGYHKTARRLIIELKRIEIEKYGYILHLGNIKDKNF